MPKIHCGRQFCPKCSEELIHRDHRRIYESSSAMGQIISREGPKNLTVADLDIVSLKKLLCEKILLRIIEHKEPDHKFQSPQRMILQVLDAIISHCLSCPGAINLKLDNRSGVYIIRGLVEGATSSRKETIFKGIQIAEKLSNGITREFLCHEDFFKFLDPEDARRREGSQIKIIDFTQKEAHHERDTQS